MREPSREWKEQVAPDEEARFRAYAEFFKGLQERKNARYGTGRALHRKGVLSLEGEFEVLDALPAHARHGLFAKPGKHRALIRLSNGSQNVQRDAVNDIRGFSFKVQGVEGPGALGGTATSQDFTLIQMETFSFPDAAQFVEFVKAATKGPAAIIGHFVKQQGLFGGLKRVMALTKSVGRPFTGFASEDFYSAAPIAVGPYAAKVRLKRARSEGSPSAKEDLAGELKQQLAKGPLTWELQLQFFVDDALTPIERANVPWPQEESPYVTVARLTVGPQPLEGEAAAKRNEEAEKGKFDPWNALAEHRPLGDVMRARKVTYYASQQGRGAA